MPVNTKTGQGIAPFTGSGTPVRVSMSTLQKLAYSYQWQRCDSGGGSCVDITDATEAVYNFTDDDIGSTVRCLVTATNVLGATTVATPVTSLVSAAATISAKTGTGISTFSASGAEAAILNRTGTGISTFTGHGSDAKVPNRLGPVVHLVLTERRRRDRARVVHPRLPLVIPRTPTRAQLTPRVSLVLTERRRRDRGRVAHQKLPLVVPPTPTRAQLTLGVSLTSRQTRLRSTRCMSVLRPPTVVA